MRRHPLGAGGLSDASHEHAGHQLKRICGHSNLLRGHREARIGGKWEFKALLRAITGHEPGAPPSDGTNQKNILLLVQLRWLAIVGQIVTIVLVQFWLSIDLPVDQMASVVGFLVLLNIVRIARTRSAQSVSETAIFVDLLGDVLALTALLYLSGGALNPFVFIYLLQIIISTVLFRGWRTWTIMVVTAICFAFLIFFHVPMELHLQSDHLPTGLHVQGMYVSFLLVGGLLVLFVGRITRNLAARDARVAELRQQAVEEDHVVRMGLLASGAAHELGTPLTTLSVILNDWSLLPALNKDPNLLTDMGHLQSQLERCKTIVSGILASAGEARGEGTIRTSLNEFFDDTAREWQATRGVDALTYVNDFTPDVPIIIDLTLQQAIFNLLDNALEAFRSEIAMSVRRAGDDVLLTIEDDGPGFPDAVLNDVGKPYISTKDRPGAGLGLFLVTNVVRKLGGKATVSNAIPNGRARVSLLLPLNTIGCDTR